MAAKVKAGAVDYEGLTDPERLALIEAILGLLPSGRGFVERAVYLAFQIAGEQDQARIEDAIERLNAVQPGWYEETLLPWAKDFGGLRWLPDQDAAA